jgi:hypothetical protein
MIAMRQRSCAELDRGMIFSLRPGGGPMVGIRRAKNYYSTSQRKRLVPKNKPVARELKGLLWVNNGYGGRSPPRPNYLR